jgi:hypothetical protein
MAHDTLKSFQRERQTPETRMALGKGIRNKTPRSSLGEKANFQSPSELQAECLQ